MSARVRALPFALLAALTAASCAAGADAEGGRTVPSASAAPTTEGGPVATQATERPAVDEEQVDAGSGAAPSPSAIEQPIVELDDEFLFDDGALHTFELLIDPDDLARIDADPSAEEYVDAMLRFGGQEFGPVGVRYKGSVGSFVGCLTGADFLNPSGEKTCTKLSMKVKVNHHLRGQELFGQRDLLFHSHNLDPSAMHERLGYWLFREMGVPAPRSTHARLVINGEYVGLFGLTEEVDGRFTRDRFDDGTGNLYKGIWPFDDRGGVRSEERLLAELETNEGDDPSADILRGFAQAIAAAGPGGAPGVLDDWADVDELLRYAVVDRAIRHDDGPFHWYCSPDGCSNQNFYWYEDPTARRVHLIAWDLDIAFVNLTAPDPYTDVADGWGEITADCAIFPHGELGLLQRSAACDPLVAALVTFDEERAALIEELVTGPMSAERIAERLDTWSALIEPALAEAAARHADATPVDEWRAAVDELETAVGRSREELGS